MSAEELHKTVAAWIFNISPRYTDISVAGNPERVDKIPDTETRWRFELSSCWDAEIYWPQSAPICAGD